jgi:hypothetical protein
VLEQNLVKTNIYRCLNYCDNCPFRDNGKKINLKDGRVKEIQRELLKSDSSFNCHKTVYDLDSKMLSTKHQDKKMCYGAYKFLKDQNKENIQMKLARMWEID